MVGTAVLLVLMLGCRRQGTRPAGGEKATVDRSGLAPKYLGMTPVDAELVATIHLGELLSAIEEMIPEAVLSRVGGEDLDDALDWLTREAGIDPRAVSEVTVVARLGENDRSAVITEAAGIDLNRLQLENTYKGVQIYRIYGGFRAAFVGNVVLAGARRRDVEWIIDCVAGDVPPFVNSWHRMNKLRLASQLLTPRRAYLKACYIPISPQDAALPEMDFAVFGFHPDEGIGAVMLSRPSAADGLERSLHKGLTQLRTAWQKLRAGILDSHLAREKFGLTQRGLRPLDQLLRELRVSVEGPRFSIDRTVGEDELRTFVAVFAFRATALLRSSRHRTARMQLKTITMALDLWRAEHRRYPASLVLLTRGEHPLLASHLLSDPWGNPFVYQLQEEGSPPYILYCTTPDGERISF